MTEKCCKTCLHNNLRDICNQKHIRLSTMTGGHCSHYKWDAEKDEEYQEMCKVKEYRVRANRIYGGLNMQCETCINRRDCWIKNICDLKSMPSNQNDIHMAVKVLNNECSCFEDEEAEK